MIHLEGITKSFGSLQVLKGIDLEIAKGEIVSIVGPSGAGKTTLLQIMGTLDSPDTGTINVDGTNVSKMKEKELSAFRNKHIGFVFQFHQLLPEFTALENVMIPAFIAGVSTKEASIHAMEILDFMGLTERASHKPNELSGIGDQVDQHLRQTVGFGTDDTIGRTKHKVEYDFGLQAQTLRTVYRTDQIVEVRSPVYEVERIGFDLSQIEYVADQLQQQLVIVLDNVHKLLFLLFVLGGEQQA